MPVKWDNPGSQSNFVIICQAAASLGTQRGGKEPGSRIMAIFMSGTFSLDEANAFAIEALDNTAVPEASEYFEHKVDIFTAAISAATMPPKMSYIFSNFSVIEPIDEYVFYLVKHDIEYFCEMLREAEARDIRRIRWRRRHRCRLGFAAEPGTSNAEIKESRPVRGFDSVTYALDSDPLPFEFLPGTDL
jgi:hypothetical protein